MREGYFVLKILRGVPGGQYFEEFELARASGANIISALMEIRKNPLNRKGESVAPVVWEDGCLEEVCGSCSMLINGVPRQACTALVENLIEKSGPLITLAPFTKFPLIRDLAVDRGQIFENFKEVHAWVDAGDSASQGFGPLIEPKQQELLYALSACMCCGCCLEACPQVNEHSAFIGPAAISQAHLFNSQPTGSKKAEARNRRLMQKGGISDCGNAQNCVRVCPKRIPLTDSIAEISKDVSLQAFHDLFSKND